MASNNPAFSSASIGSRRSSAQSAPAPAKDGYDNFGSISRLQRYAGNIPIAGGVVQTIYGVKEIHAAKTGNAKANGVVDTVLGSSSAISTVASLPLYAVHNGDRTTGIIGGVKIASGGVSAVGAFTGALPLMIAGGAVYLAAVAFQNRQSIANAAHAVKDAVVGAAGFVADKL